MLKLTLAAAACLLLVACASADGSRPRLAAGDGDTGAAGFNGGYAGTNGGFGNLTTRSSPF